MLGSSTRRVHHGVVRSLARLIGASNILKSQTNKGREGFDVGSDGYIWVGGRCHVPSCHGHTTIVLWMYKPMRDWDHLCGIHLVIVPVLLRSWTVECLLLKGVLVRCLWGRDVRGSRHWKQGRLLEVGYPAVHSARLMSIHGLLEWAMSHLSVVVIIGGEGRHRSWERMYRGFSDRADDCVCLKLLASDETKNW